MQPSSFPPPRPAAGGRAGPAILLILITMIVLVGIDLATWHFQAEKIANHEDLALWGAYLGFGVITGLVALLVRSSSAAVPVIGVIVVAAGSFADLFLIFPVISDHYGAGGFSEALEQEMKHVSDFLKSEPSKVYFAIGSATAIFLILSLIGLVAGRSRVRRTPVPYGQSPLPYGQHQNPYAGPQTPPPFTPGGPPPQQGPQTPPPFPGPGLYSPPPYGQPQSPQQHGQPAGPPSFGQQSPPPYDPETPPRSPSEPPPYGQQNPPPYGQNEPPSQREDAERDEPGPELPPLPPPPPPPR